MPKRRVGQHRVGKGSIPFDRVVVYAALFTYVDQAGVHPKVVSERLGHSTVSITLDTYSHAIPALEEAAAAKVARLVFGR